MAGRPGAGGMVGEASIKVRYAETDQMGVVYHSNYLIWFEIGRVELLRQIGFSYLELERSQYHLPVVEVRCRYKAPALYDETVIIRTHVSQLRPSLIQFTYQAVRASDGTLLAEGETTHIVVGAEKKKTQLPAKYLEPLRRAMGESR